MESEGFRSTVNILIEGNGVRVIGMYDKSEGFVRKFWIGGRGEQTCRLKGKWAKGQGPRVTW